MPRPAGTSYIVLVVLLTLPFTTLTATSTAASQTPPPGGVSRQGLGGIWVLNRNSGDSPGAPPSVDGTDNSGNRRGSGGGGGFGGRMGRRGGGRGYGGGQGGQGTAPQDDGRQQAIGDYVRTQIADVSKQLTIVVHEGSVVITDADGRVVSLETNDKKADERAQNGLVKLARKSHWDGNTLISEIDIENGPKIVRNYAVSPGGTQLTITTSVDRSGRPIKLTHVYERPVESR